MDFFEEPKPRKVALTKPVKLDLGPASQEESLRTVEDKILTKAMTVVQDALHFADIDMGTEVCPAEWIDDIGPEAAARRYRAATWAQLNQKEAPVGLKYAKEVLVGIVKARATEKQEPRKLNIAITKIDFQLPEFPSQAVDR